MGERTSRQLVHQRIRNRLIEYFELLSSEADLLDYEASVPINLFAEIINQWEDWLAEPGQMPKADSYPIGVYSKEEVVEILRFHMIWDAVSGSTPDTIDGIADFFAKPEWPLLQSAAASALVVFAKRGKLSENEESNP